LKQRKTLGTIDVLRLSMHVNVTPSQEAFVRNCALSMAADLFSEWGSSHDGEDAIGSEINLLKMAAFRRFIAETTMRSMMFEG
jgi:hypothetical protein